MDSCLDVWRKVEIERNFQSHLTVGLKPSVVFFMSVCGAVHCLCIINDPHVILTKCCRSLALLPGVLFVGSVFLHVRAAAVPGPTSTDADVGGFVAAPSHTQRTQRYAADIIGIINTRAEPVPVCICPLAKPVPVYIYHFSGYHRQRNGHNNNISGEVEWVLVTGALVGHEFTFYELIL